MKYFSMFSGIGYGILVTWIERYISRNTRKNTEKRTEKSYANKSVNAIVSSARLRSRNKLTGIENADGLDVNKPLNIMAVNVLAVESQR